MFTLTQRKDRRLGSARVTTVSACGISLLMALSGLAAAGAAPVGASIAKSAPVKIVVEANSVNTTNAPFFVALGTGLFKKYNLDVSYESVATTVLYTELGNNTIQMGFANLAGLSAAVAGVPVTFIADIGPEYFELLAQAKIKNIKGLAGQTVGASALGSTSDTALKATLTDNHVPFGNGSGANLTYFNGSAATSFVALSAGSIAATMVSAPQTLQVEATDPGLHDLGNTFNLPKNVGEAAELEIATGSQWASSHKTAVKDFMKAYRQGISVIKSDPTKAAQVISTYSGVSADLQSAADNVTASALQLTPISKSLFNYSVKILSPYNPTIVGASYSKYVDNSYAQ